MNGNVERFTYTLKNAKVLPGISFIPAHFKNGKRVECRAKFRVVCTDSITDVYMGMFYSKCEIKSHTYEITAWSKWAYTCCLHFSEGRRVDLICEPQSYTGPVFLEDGSILMDSNKAPVMLTRVSFIVVQIILGDETQDQISGEIKVGIRPKFWNVPGSNDYNVWQSIIWKRCNLKPDIRRKKFGFAKMEKPKGHNIKIEKIKGHDIKF